MSPKLLNILLILLPAFLYFGYLNPMYNGVPGFIWSPEFSITALQSQNVQYKDALQQISLIETEIGKINSQYKKITDEEKLRATMLLPDKIDPIKLRNEVVSIANKKGIAISGLQVVNSCQGALDKSLGCYLVTLTVHSRYPVLKELIEAYEKSLRLFVVSNVLISKPTKKDSQGSAVGQEEDKEALDSNMSFRVYYLK